MGRCAALRLAPRSLNVMFNLILFAASLMLATSLEVEAGENTRVLKPLNSEYHSIYISESSNIYSKPGVHDARIPKYADIRVGKDVGILVKSGEKWIHVVFPVVEIIKDEAECKLMSESGYKNNEKMIDVVYLKECGTN